MNILHVTLGNPYTHQGGLNTYCSELAEEQIAIGHNVNILYAGNYGSGEKSYILHVKDNLYELKNALPVPITYGIDIPERYMSKGNKKNYYNWLKEMNIDVIHIHSIMGIYKEFFDAAKELKIYMIFTTHDYYPICFKSNLVNDSGILCEGYDCNKCVKCNLNAGLSSKKQRLIQSRFYQKIKKSYVIKTIKKILSNIKKEKNNNQNTKSVEQVDDFKKLHKYYENIISDFNKIHCNSMQTQRYYSQYYPNANYKVVTICNREIVKKKHIKQNGNLKISYFGGMSKHKGYLHIKKMIEWLQKSEYINWQMNLYGGDYNDDYNDDRVHAKGYFSKKDIENVWKETDLLIIPSQCPETYGFSLAEALARNIPVICTELVGAKDLLGEELQCESVYMHNDYNALKDKIEPFFNENYYKKICEKIEKLNLKFDMKLHAENIVNIYEVK